MPDGDRQTEPNPAKAESRCGAPWGKPELTLFRAGDARNSPTGSVDGAVNQS